MLNFTFVNPTQILFGKGRIADLPRVVPAKAKVLITYGGGSIISNGVLAEVKAALKDYTYFEFSGIEPNPSYETLMQAVELARREQVDFLLAVGGGSVMDGTKFIAAAIPFEGDPWDILAKRAKVTVAVPMGTVVTLPATGSEMNSGAVISKKATEDKLAFSSSKVFPAFSIMDPEKTFTLPPKQVANGVVDAFVHVMEQYLTFSVDGKVQDRLSEGLLLTLIEEGPKALSNPLDYNVRANIMWAATLALNGLISAGVPQDWGTHMIGHEVTALFGVDHARTLAIILPAMMSIQRAEKREKLLQYAERIWGIHTGSDDARIDAAIQKTRDFFESLGVPTRFSAYEIGEAGRAHILAQLERHGMTALGENRSVTLEKSKAVLACAA